MGGRRWFHGFDDVCRGYREEKFRSLTRGRKSAFRICWGKEREEEGGGEGGMGDMQLWEGDRGEKVCILF